MVLEAPLRDDPSIRTLWPEPATLRRTHRSGADFLAVPDVHEPRFLLPRDRRAALAVLRHFRSDGTAASRRRITALKTVIATTGGWPLVTCGLEVSTPPAALPETIGSVIAQALGEPVILGVHFGPPRANRKPILQVLDRDRQPLAFGKVGINPLTHRLVGTESAALALLGRTRIEGVRTPALLEEITWNDARILLTTVLPVRSATSNVSGPVLEAAMVSVARAVGVESCPPGQSPHLLRLREAAGALPHAEVRDRCLGALRVIMRRTDDWLFGMWHGDWMDWNFARHGSDLLLWDWERHALGAPLGWDALHHALRRAFLTQEVSVDVTRTLLSRAAGLLRPFGVREEQAEAIACAYLVELAVRYTADGQRDAGGRTARVEEWLLPVLPHG